VEEAPGGRRPQSRLWDPRVRRYSRLTLSIKTMRDQNARPDPATQVAAMAEARARLSEIDRSVGTPRASDGDLTLDVRSAIDYAIRPGTKARHSGSREDAEWRRAEEEIRIALPDERLAAVPVAADVRLVCCSAMLRASAGADRTAWRDYLVWARSHAPVRADSQFAPWEQQLHAAYRRAMAQAQPSELAKANRQALNDAAIPSEAAPP
jgi:hypothetical protein